jgi:photosystem II stability/assembly factor-like uncharacterized protein
VGDRATILATEDAGVHWLVQPSPTQNSLSSVAFAEDGRLGWAVGFEGTILATADAGNHWMAKASPIPDFLHGVAFAEDGRHGWAVSESGTILATENAGVQWAAQASPTEQALYGVTFAGDGRHGWAVGWSGTILATEDAGDHWVAQTSPTHNGLLGVAFTRDGRHGWAVGVGGTILATEDAGDHWVGQASPTQYNLRSIAFDADGRHGWAAGRNGTILATEDAGDHWVGQASPTQNYLRSIVFAADGRHGWAVGLSGTILATGDAGAHWVAQASPIQDDLYSVAFAGDGRHGCTVGAGGTILATEDAGAHWVAQASPTQDDLGSVAFVRDGRWAVGGGTLLLTVGQPGVDRNSVNIHQVGQAITISFALHTDPDFPIWASNIEARTSRRPWEIVGSATETAEKWQISWEPSENDFRPGDTIEHRVVIRAGALPPVREPLGSPIQFDPWWPRLWRENETAILAVGTPLGVFALYALGFLLVLLVAPARLARVGAAPLGDIPPPSGNWAFVWGLLKTSWETVALFWLCGNRRVRLAWMRQYMRGQSKLTDLGKFARQRFVEEPEFLDAWVGMRIAGVGNALKALELYGQRQTYVPLPVRIGETRIVERPDATMLHQTLAQSRAVLCVVGAGGSGKSTLACAMARWAMADDPKERLTPHRIIPVFIVQETTNLTVAVTRTLREMLGEEELPDDLVRGLLARKRVLVIVDALSEREMTTQQHVEQVFAESAIFNAVAITSRAAPKLGAVERTILYPLLLDQKRIVPFIVDYVARLPNAEPLQGGRTLLQLGNRILELAEAGGRATPVTPLLVTMFVDSAISRASVGQALEDLPQDVPGIFADYLKRVYKSPSTGAAGTAEDEFVHAARVLAELSLGARLVPGDFTPEEAKAKLDASGLGADATMLLQALLGGGVLESRTIGVTKLLRFSLDPVSEYLTAMKAVSDLRQLGQDKVVFKIHKLTRTEGYPGACEGYLKAFATCYRVYGDAFKLPDLAFPWESAESAKPAAA